MTSTSFPQRIAILGVGLLGGSVALSLRRRLPEIEIVGFSRSDAKRKLAIDLGVIDQAAESPEAACRDCDVVVVAAPVDKISPMVNQVSTVAPPDCLITDVGSTKATIVNSVTSPRFVAAHPIAGSEKTGVQNATADLFDTKIIVITPGETTEPASLEKCVQFWQLTGGQTVQMNAADHDAHLAAVSHVPHLVSSLVARLLPDSAGQLVGSGWRDMTRVAAGDPTLWTAICHENRAAILDQLEQFLADTNRLQELIRTADDKGLHQWLADAKATKDATP